MKEPTIKNQTVKASEQGGNLDLEKAKKNVTAADIAKGIGEAVNDLSLYPDERAMKAIELAKQLKSREKAWLSKKNWEKYSPGEQIARAREIMGDEEVMGVEEVRDVFSIAISPEDIPSIPFSPDELERAKELRQFLILRANQLSNGQWLTLEKIKNIIRLRNGMVLDIKEWLEKQDFYTGVSSVAPVECSYPRFGWALTSSEIIKGSCGCNYLDQTEAIAKYLREEVFLDRDMNMTIEWSLIEWDANKKNLFDLRDHSHRRTSAEENDKMRINEDFRHNPAELVYDTLVYGENNGKDILQGHKAMTYVSDPNCSRILVLSSPSSRVCIRALTEAASDESLGTMFSRRF